MSGLAQQSLIEMGSARGLPVGERGDKSSNLLHVPSIKRHSDAKTSCGGPYGPDKEVQASLIRSDMMTPGVLLAGWHAVWKLGLILPDVVGC